MTRGPDKEELARRLKGRQLAIVSVVAAIVFMVVEFLGATYGWSNAVMGLFELSVAAVFHLDHGKRIFFSGATARVNKGHVRNACR